jgi:hypothetical protein
MNLPKDNTHNSKHKEPKRQTWIAVLSIIAIVVSLASAGFSAFVYSNTPLQIHNYIQSHKNELKGADGRDGSDGRNGANSYSPTSCSSYDYGYGYSSTNCY